MLTSSLPQRHLSPSRSKLAISSENNKTNTHTALCRRLAACWRGLALTAATYWLPSSTFSLFSYIRNKWKWLESRTCQQASGWTDGFCCSPSHLPCGTCRIRPSSLCQSLRRALSVGGKTLVSSHSQTDGQLQGKGYREMDKEHAWIFRANNQLQLCLNKELEMMRWWRLCRQVSRCPLVLQHLSCNLPAQRALPVAVKHLVTGCKKHSGNHESNVLKTVLIL